MVEWIIRYIYVQTFQTVSESISLVLIYEVIRIIAFNENVTNY